MKQTEGWKKLSGIIITIFIWRTLWHPNWMKFVLYNEFSLHLQKTKISTDWFVHHKHYSEYCWLIRFETKKKRVYGLISEYAWYVTFQFLSYRLYSLSNRRLSSFKFIRQKKGKEKNPYVKLLHPLQIKLKI